MTLFLDMVRKKDGRTIPISTNPKLLKFKGGEHYIIGTVDKSISSALLRLHEMSVDKYSIEEIVEKALDMSIELFDIQGDAVKVDFDPEYNSFEVLGSHGMPPDYPLQRDKPLRDTASFQAYEFGEPIFIENLSNKQSAAVSGGMKSGVFVPLWIKYAEGHVDKIGTLCLYINDAANFESLKRKMRDINRIADTVAKKISESRLSQEQKDEAIRLEALQAATSDINSSLELESIVNRLVDRVQEYFTAQAKIFFGRREIKKGVRRVSVYIYDPKEAILNPFAWTGHLQKPKPVKMGEGIIGKVAQDKRAIVVPDMSKYKDRPGTGSFLSVPILKGDELIGVLNVSSEEERFFKPHVALKSLKEFSEKVATAIVNAREHERTLLISGEDPIIPMVLNQRFGYFMLALDLQKAQRNNVPLSVIMADLDHFKTVNDTWGHLKGNETLINIGEFFVRMCLAEKLPPPYRLGEEWVFSLYDRDIKAAEEFAEKLRQGLEVIYTIADKDVDKDDPPEEAKIRVTASFGVAEFPHDGDTPDDLLNLADGLLYDAKELGRNQVVVRRK